MVIKWIDKQFPNIIGKYKKTSDRSKNYNCIAWACDDTTSWWMPFPGYRWPNAPRTLKIGSLVTVFIGMGYEICDNDHLEDGFDKVVLYEKTGMWTHACKQLPNGRWTSKLGEEEDIEHFTPQDLIGDLYGEIHCIMKKVKS